MIVKTKDIVSIFTGIVALASAIIVAPILIAYDEDISATVNSMELHGRNTKFVCRWTDGRDALMRDTSSGKSHLVTVSSNSERLVSGGMYVVSPGLYCRWGRLPGQLRKI